MYPRKGVHSLSRRRLDPLFNEVNLRAERLKSRNLAKVVLRVRTHSLNLCYHWNKPDHYHIRYPKAKLEAVTGVWIIAVATVSRKLCGDAWCDAGTWTIPAVVRVGRLLFCMAAWHIKTPASMWRTFVAHWYCRQYTIVYVLYCKSLIVNLTLQSSSVYFSYDKEHGPSRAVGKSWRIPRIRRWFDMFYITPLNVASVRFQATWVFHLPESSKRVGWKCAWSRHGAPRRRQPTPTGKMQGFEGMSETWKHSLL